VYALDTMLNSPTPLGKAALLKAMQGHVLAKGQLLVKYLRKQK
jgi:phosphatidylethanolamine-binding protein (PEBP) family uncharacterized protein